MTGIGKNSESCPPKMSPLMFGMPCSEKDHGLAVFSGSLDDFRLPERLSRLDDGGNARLCGEVDAVPEWEEGIGSEHTSLCGQVGLHPRDPYGVHPAHLSCPDADQLIFIGVNDG